MARLARVVAVGVPHHVTQRGNDRQTVFETDLDRVHYMEALRFHCRQQQISLLGYCLMSNHVHLVAVPHSPAALAQGLGRAHYDYARGFNRRHQRSGHLWQNRFYSCPLSGKHLRLALRYVDLNPVRARLVEQASDYAWSSARAHITGCDPLHLLDTKAWEVLDLRPDWEDCLRAAEQSDNELLLRQSTYSGRPLGDRDFLRQLEVQLRRRLWTRGPGRPCKEQALATSALNAP
jgi:putative transposase